MGQQKPWKGNDNRGGSWDNSNTMTLRPLTQNAKDALLGPANTVPEFERKLSALAAEATILVPALTAIQPGWSIALCLVEVAPHELAPVSGSQNKQPTKPVINRVANAAGVQWIKTECHRLDDGSDPHYCNYTVGGRRRSTDGSWLTFCDEYELDLREASPRVLDSVMRAIGLNVKRASDNYCDPRPAMSYPHTLKDRIAFCECVTQYNALVERSNLKWKDKKSAKLSDPWASVNQQRTHILSLSITKAKLRALRQTLGMPIAGPAEQMRRFIIGKPYFSGNFGDARLDNLAKEAMIASATGGSQIAFGGETAALPPPADARPKQSAPPALPSVAESIENYDPDNEPEWDDGTRQTQLVQRPRTIDEGTPAPDVDPDVPDVDPDVPDVDPDVPDVDPDEARAAAIKQTIELARSRGLYGRGEGKANEEEICQWSDDKICKAIAKLESMPAVKSDEDIPFG